MSANLLPSVLLGFSSHCTSVYILAHAHTHHTLLRDSLSVTDVRHHTPHTHTHTNTHTHTHTHAITTAAIPIEAFLHVCSSNLPMYSPFLIAVEQCHVTHSLWIFLSFLHWMNYCGHYCPQASTVHAISTKLDAKEVKLKLNVLHNTILTKLVHLSGCM